MTEITNSPAVTVVGSGFVPPAVSFDAFVPSPDPTAPSCAIEYECYEGMLVEVFAGTVAASNQAFGSDPFAEIHVVARSGRAFREPGIEFPGLVDLPEWDGNPEVFELDADKLLLPNENIPAGSTFSATGVIGFEFNHYELWPSELTVNSAPLPVPVRPAEPNELTVGSLNLFRLFDGDTLALSKLSSYIHEVLRSPDILAVQEVESFSVLEDLADQIFDDTSGVVDYTAYLEEGNDIGGIDVGFLVRQGIAVSTGDPARRGRAILPSTTRRRCCTTGRRWCSKRSATTPSRSRSWCSTCARSAESKPSARSRNASNRRSR